MARGRRGFGLVELMVAVAVAGIVATIAVPRMNTMIAVIRVRGAVNRVAADLAFTRHLAVRTGCRARLVLERSPECLARRGQVAGHRYRIVVATRGGDSVAYRADLRLDGSKLCLASNQSSAVVFNSRGLLAPFNNRTLTITQGRAPPRSITLSAVGRILRR